MLTHILGLVTLASIILAAPVTVRLLWVAGTQTTSWLRLPPTPLLVAGVTPSSPPGPAGFSDYVGHL